MTKNKTKTKINKKKEKNFQFENGEIVIYASSLYDKYKGKECVIFSRSKEKKVNEWYRVRFDDGNEILTTLSALKKKEKVID